jgi:type II secretory pathway pseudopilin PulG
MNSRGLTLLEVAMIIIVIGILAAILLPPVSPGIRRARVTSCASNLRQLYHLGASYASTHQGQWPGAKGSALWMEFTKTNPPLIGRDELEVLLCPVKGEPDLGHCDYLGPSKTFSELKPTEGLAADKPGNHGDEPKANVLLKDGSVQEYELSHPIWETLSD